MSFVAIALYRRAFCRSRLRVRALLALEELGLASVNDIARALGAEPRNVLGAIVGDGASYRVEESLARLGLVDVRREREVDLFVLTDAGSTVAVWVRRELGREARSGVKLLLA